MRPIDADKLLENLKKTDRYFMLKFDIEEAPTIEVRPHGEWVFDKDGYFSCSCCRRKPKYQGAITDFCPNCGADMREGEAE